MYVSRGLKRPFSRHDEDSMFFLHILTDSLNFDSSIIDPLMVDVGEVTPDFESINGDELIRFSERVTYGSTQHFY